VSDVDVNRRVQEAGDPAAPVPLRRNVPFQLLWTGAAFSILGLEIAALVLPLVVLFVTGSPGAAGAVAAVEMIAGLVLGLPAGELVDRFDRRRVLVAVELVRAAGAASLAVALAVGSLTLPHLLVVAVLLGSMRPFSATARMLMIRTLVPSSQLTAALTREEARVSGASLVGPPLGGVLYALAAVVPLVATAVSSLIASVCMALVRVPPTPADDKAPAEAGTTVLRRIGTGLTVLWRSSVLRRTTLFTAAMNAASAPLVLIAVVHLTEQGTPAGMIGVATAGLAVGGLTGTLLIKHLNRLAPGTLMLGQAGSLALLLCLLSLPWGPWGAAVALFLTMLGVPTMRVLVDIVLFRQVPDAQRGRVASAAMTLWGAGSALSTLAAGLLLDVAPVRVVLLCLAGVIAAVFAAGLLNPRFRRTAWPAETA
jgi:MFS family permease